MTEKYAILGNPVAHSLSPVLHGLFAKMMHDDITYEKILVESGMFSKTCADFFRLGGNGCNITVPCKVDACEFADNLTEYAKCAGAVNTLKKMPDGSVLGDNTDGRGLVNDLKRLGINLSKEHVLIIGAGGAAKGILLPILKESPLSVTMTNRHFEKLESIREMTDERVNLVRQENLEPKYSLILNATSSSLMGVLPNIENRVIASSSFVYDLMYHKEHKTIFTEHAKKLGVKNVADGFGMLVLQAVLGYELWHGHAPDTAAAFNEIAKIAL